LREAYIIIAEQREASIAEKTELIQGLFYDDSVGHFTHHFLKMPRVQLAEHLVEGIAMWQA
jgi:hypothetical protein